MTVLLSDEMLVEILKDAESDMADGLDVFRTHPRVVAQIIRESRRLRADVARQRGVIDENNALWKNNERLRRRIADADDVEAVLRQALDDARKSASTAQTMAAHWKLKANGGQ